MTVDAVLAWLERRQSRRNREGMARFGIRSDRVFGVSMATMRPLVRRIGRDHALALELWESGWLEARILASFVDEPARVTSAQMDRWVRGFDNWAVCDSACTHLFDRTPYAWRKVRTWSARRADDLEFVAALPLIEQASSDDRNFVRKAVNWALRQIGKRNQALNAAAVDVASRLACSTERAPRWIGSDALRELTSAAVQQRLARAGRQESS